MKVATVIIGFCFLFLLPAVASAFGLDLSHAHLLGHLDAGMISLGFVGMAKVSGPLMSMQASGKFADTLVFSNRKGANVVRQLVIPANPMSANQEIARNRVRVCGAAQAYCNLEAQFGEARTITDKAGLVAAAPGNQTWNSYLVDLMIGAGNVNYDAAVTAYTALTSGQKTAWDTAAGALTPAILSVAQKVAGGGAGTAVVPGKVWFIYQYGLSVGGLASSPGATPPTYA